MPIAEAHNSGANAGLRRQVHTTGRLEITASGWRTHNGRSAWITLHPPNLSPALPRFSFPWNSTPVGAEFPVPVARGWRADSSVIGLVSKAASGLTRVLILLLCTFALARTPGEAQGSQTRVYLPNPADEDWSCDLTPALQVWPKQTPCHRHRVAELLALVDG
jgi:hypothetical protein